MMIFENLFIQIKSVFINGVFGLSLGELGFILIAFILALLTGARATLKNFETVYTSSPSFLKIINFLGAKFEKN